MNIETIVSSILGNMEFIAKFHIAVFWLEEQGDRDHLCNELTQVLAGNRVALHILRKPLFSDPNGWAADTMAVIDVIKDQVLKASKFGDAERPFGLLIIARNKLNITQSSSPAIAPDWFPGHGGREIMVLARDVHSIASCSLAAPEAAIEAIKSSLYELELGLLKIVKNITTSDKHHGQKIWGEILKERSKLERKSEFLELWEKGLNSVTDAPNYRPSLTSGWSMISAMWDIFLKSSPSQLLSKSEAFVEYFDVKANWMPPIPLPAALLPILFRGSDDHRRSDELIAGRNLLVTVGLACQLVTAAAHADQYGKVSAVALEAVSKDLRIVLSAVVQRAGWLNQPAFNDH